ncbi:MAG: hypothetical protein HYR55_13655 [Acidobacteria bacterium]|nr:hypothetical protein [Acidobacteriota bacterium]
MTFGEFTLRWFLWIAMNGGLFFGAYKLCSHWARLQSAELATAMGIVVVAGLVGVETVCGAMGRLDFWTVGSGLALLAVLMVWGNRRRESNNRIIGASGSRWTWQGASLPNRVWLFLVIATGVHLASRVVLSLIPPPSNWDSIWYHLPSVVEWLKSGSLWVSSEPPYWYHPRNAELLLAWWLLPFRSDLLASLYSFPILLWLAYSVWALSERLGLSKEWRWFLVLALPNLGVMASVVLGTQKNDLLVAALFISALTHLMARNQQAGNDDGRVFLSALALGLLIGTKLNGLIYGLFILLIWLCAMAFKGGSLATIRRAITYYAGGALLGVFWFARNWFLTGTPLWVVDPHAPSGQGQEAMASSLIAGPFSLETLRLLFMDTIQGAGWWPILGLVGSIVVVCWSPLKISTNDRIRARGVAGLTIASLLAFLATPRTGLVTSGHSIIRLGLPFVILALVSFFALIHWLTLDWPASRRRWGAAVLSVFVLVPSGMPDELLRRLVLSPRGLATLALFGLMLGIAWRAQWRALIARWAFGSVLALLALSPIFLWKLQNYQWSHWGGAYGDLWNIDGVRSGIFQWLESTENTKIAVYGSQIFYPFYGSRWQNQLYFDVESSVNVRERWLDRLSQDRVNLVVFYKVKKKGPTDTVELQWPREREWVVQGGSSAFAPVYRDRIAEAWSVKNLRRAPVNECDFRAMYP